MNMIKGRELRRFDCLEIGQERGMRRIYGTRREHPNHLGIKPKGKTQYRSYELDDDDSLPFSRELRNAHVLSHFVLPKIPKYEGK